MAEAMLRHFIAQAAGSRSRTNVIVCVPSGITPVERDALEKATIDAGAAKAFLIEEPLAAAIGPAQDHEGLAAEFLGQCGDLPRCSASEEDASGRGELESAATSSTSDRPLQGNEQLLIGQEQAEKVLKLEIGSAVRTPRRYRRGRRSDRHRLAAPAVVGADAVRTALERPRAIGRCRRPAGRRPAASSDVATRASRRRGARCSWASTGPEHVTGLDVSVDSDRTTVARSGAGEALEEMSAPAGRQRVSCAGSGANRYRR
jgi:actin-like ATPase involved in cell morphogenesis